MIKIIQFSAKWCHACHEQTDLLKPFCEENNIEYVLIDVDDDFEMAELYNVSMLPTIVIEKSNEDVIKFIGFTALQEIENVVKGL